MLLDDLYKIAQLGSEKPLFLWLEKFREFAPGLAEQLDAVVLELTEGTDVKKNVEILVKLLKEEEPNELELAQALSHVADLFREAAPAEHRDLINDYIRAVMKFINLTQASEFSRQAREKLLNTLSEEQQREYDRKIFGHEGMIYCLEYYLAMYKAMTDAPTEAEARKYLESTEVNLGFGNVPGLWIDFSRDEVLSKFVYVILNDTLRKRLTSAYFDTKLVMMKVKMNCDKQGSCEAHYQDTTLEEVKESFRKLILELLETFAAAGIERLASFFFKPYGDKPLIKEVIEKI